ncbi:hypothetical protein B0H15DRAFT_216480 [Mycena belliarum]|uniref:Uncharacterized protein n=1 Tax=Mycena belliarum TaxID=1033014 RepID=A0AAD6XXU5_9AGAR|nr:hypothetical protein B0H15DRAFT_216480 [Mycena belliae]
MKWFSLLGLLAASIPLAAAQSTNRPASSTSAGSPSAQVTVITSLSTGVTIVASNGGRVEVSTTATILITSTIATTAAAAASSSANGGSSSAASSTSTANLPTGSAGLVTDQAPAPGAPGGPYGPPDTYINAAHTLRRNTLLLSLGSVVVGGLLVA